jgi:hypothetical protein
LEDLAMELMGLVDNHEVDLWSFATGDRLDAAHLDRLVSIGALMDSLYDADAVNAFCLERGDGLIDEAERRDREGDALTSIEGALDDVCCSQRLAEARGRLKQEASLAGR